MPISITLSELAQRQAAAGYAYYEQISKRLAVAFTDEIDRVLGNILQHPQMYVLVFRDYRQALLRRFPYRLFYRIENDRIFVLGILHQRRDLDPFLRELEFVDE